MALDLHIETANAAMRNDEGGVDLLEVRRQLGRVAERLILGDTDGAILDLNGNTVGHFLFAPDAEGDEF